MDVMSVGLKRKVASRIVPCVKFKSQHLRWHGDVLVPVASVTAPLML